MQLSQYVLPFKFLSLKFFIRASSIFCLFFCHYLRILRKTINAFFVVFVFSLRTCTISRCTMPATFLLYSKHGEKIREKTAGSFFPTFHQHNIFSCKNANVRKMQSQLNVLLVTKIQKILYFG